ncbi:MAG: WD40/YVTN/BNR-like repeat-containing protein [Thermoanaerobaculia bacterium]
MYRLLSFLLAAAIALPVFGQWRPAGLFGADVRSLALDPADPDRIFVGTSLGELYVSNDGAATWTNPRKSNPFPDYVVDNLAFDRSGRLWAACWGLWGGGVIAVSEDGGTTWTRRDAGLEEFSPRALALDPSNAEHAIVGGLTGIHQTFDGGVTWAKISSQVNVESLAIDPRSPQRLYAGTWRQMFRSNDGGATWKLASKGMVLDTDVFSILIDEKAPDRIWASTCGWVYNSTNGGDAWTRVRDGLDNRRIHAIAIDPVERKRVFAGSVAGLYVTEDGGTSWKRITDDTKVVNAIGISAARPDRIVLATEGDGIYVSRDRGATFTRSSDGLRNVRVTAIVSDPETSGRVYAAVVHGNAASGIYESSDAGERWIRLSETPLPEILTLVVQKGEGARFVAGTEKGFYWSVDGRTWTMAETPLLTLRVEKIVHYSDVRMFAASADGVFTSRDRGRNWSRLKGSSARSIDIAVGDYDGNPALYALKESGLSVFDGVTWTEIAGAPEKARRLFAGRGKESGVVVFGTPAGASVGVVDAGRWVALSGSEPLARQVANAGAIDRAILAVHEATVSPFSGRRAWKGLHLPVEQRLVSSIASDSIDEDRLYLATNGSGIYVFGPRVGAGVAANLSGAR